MHWIKARDGDLPPNAVQGGYRHDKTPFYVARAHHAGALIPGKLLPGHGVTYIGWRGSEFNKTEYEVITPKI